MPIMALLPIFCICEKPHWQIQFEIQDRWNWQNIVLPFVHHVFQFDLSYLRKRLRKGV